MTLNIYARVASGIVGFFLLAIGVAFLGPAKFAFLCENVSHPATASLGLSMIVTLVAGTFLGLAFKKGVSVFTALIGVCWALYLIVRT